MVSVLLTGLFVFLALFLPLESLVKAASTVILASYVLTNLAVIVLRESGLASYRPTFRSPLYPWLQLGCAVLFSWFIVSLGSETIEITLALLLIAFCAYFFYGRKGDRGEYALLHTLRRIADRRIIGNALENELIDIVIDRDGIEQDVFDRLVRDCEILDLEYEATFERVAGKISRKLADRYGVDAELVYGEYLRRQRETNTALNEFLAIPHVAVGSGDLLFLYVVRCRKGIRFTADVITSYSIHYTKLYDIKNLLWGRIAVDTWSKRLFSPSCPILGTRGPHRNNFVSHTLYEVIR